jgi:hypothetical protein
MCGTVAASDNRNPPFSHISYGGTFKKYFCKRKYNSVYSKIVLDACAHYTVLQWLIGINSEIVIRAPGLVSRDSDNQGSTLYQTTMYSVTKHQRLRSNIFLLQCRKYATKIHIDLFLNHKIYFIWTKHVHNISQKQHRTHTLHWN